MAITVGSLTITWLLMVGVPSPTGYQVSVADVPTQEECKEKLAAIVEYGAGMGFDKNYPLEAFCVRHAEPIPVQPTSGGREGFMATPLTM